MGIAMTRFQQYPQETQQQSSMGSKDLIEMAVSGLGGLALGAALMYLFDPEVGQDRRQRVADAAGSAIDATTSAVSGAGEYISDAVSSVRDRFGSSTSDAVDDYSGRIRSTWESARDAVSSYIPSNPRKQTRGYLSDLSDRARSLGKSARDYVPSVRFGDKSEGFSTTTTAIGAFGALALGCAAMYFLDPRQGRARRAYIAQKASRLVNDSAGLARATGRHLANRSKGLYYESRRAVTAPFQSVDDNTLLDQIRTTLGRLTGASNVEASGTSGVIILRGQCDPNQIYNIVSTVEGLTGVRHVENELRAYDSAMANSPHMQTPNPSLM